MDKYGVVAAQFLPHLADSFQERQRFDVTHGAADLDNRDIHVLRHLLHGAFNFIGHMRNHLDGFAEIITTPFFGNDLLVDTSGGPVVVAGEPGVGETLIMSKIKVGFRAIVGNEDLTMLKG